MNPNNKDTYIVTLTCSLESSTPMVVNLTPFELKFVEFIANLSGKLAKDDLSKPFVIVEKFPYDEYKKHKLGSYKQATYKEILRTNKKAYTKIKHEIQKKIKATPNSTNGNGVE